MFAEGAAIGSPDSLRRARATGWLGILIPINPVYAVRIIGITSRFARATRVRGPGQKCSPSFLKISMTLELSCDIRFNPSSKECTCTIRGSVRGLPLVVKINRHAASLSALAPRPYTVSVGNETNFPCLRASVAD